MSFIWEPTSPAERFEETVRAVRANLVVLVSQTLASAASLQHVALILSSKKISVGYGGRIFNMRPEIIKHISGHHLGNDVSSVLEEVEHIRHWRHARVGPIFGPFPAAPAAATHCEV